MKGVMMEGLSPRCRRAALSGPPGASLLAKLRVALRWCLRIGSILAAPILLGGCAGTEVAHVPSNPATQLQQAENYFGLEDYGHAIAIIKGQPNYLTDFTLRYDIAVATFNQGDLLTAQSELDAAAKLAGTSSSRISALQQALNLEHARPIPVPPKRLPSHTKNTGLLAHRVDEQQRQQCYATSGPTPCIRLNWINLV